MIGKTGTTFFITGLLLTYAVGAPVDEKKNKKQISLAIPIVIGLEELLAGSAAVVGAAGAASILSQSHINTHSDPDSHACSGYSSKYGRTTGGWCRPGCEPHEIVVANGSCGSNVCCIPNN